MRPACLFVFPLLSLSAQAQSRSIAITFDDLICANCAPRNQTDAKASETMESTNSWLVHKLSKANVSVTGFVITKTLEQSGAAGKRGIQLWLNAGFDLGNHTHSHPNFADITTEQMQVEVAQAASTLRTLLAGRPRSPTFFRFSYNDSGNTEAKHVALAQYLKEHAYQVATCTIDTSDYVFASAYSRALGVGEKGMSDKIKAACLELAQQRLISTRRQIGRFSAMSHHKLCCFMTVS